jgi:hypothetical protein
VLGLTEEILLRLKSEGQIGALEQSKDQLMKFLFARFPFANPQVHFSSSKNGKMGALKSTFFCCRI